MAGSTPDVTKEDQDKINTFNKRFQRLKEIEAELEGKKKLAEDCDDASNELMLIEDEQVRYLVGECFFHATPEEAEDRLQTRLAAVRAEESELEEEASTVRAEMERLKEMLYSKFGTSINLEE